MLVRWLLLLSLFFILIITLLIVIVVVCLFVCLFVCFCGCLLLLFVMLLYSICFVCLFDVISSSEDYMERRNALLLLSQSYTAFPVVEKYSEFRHVFECTSFLDLLLLSIALVVRVSFIVFKFVI